MKISAKDGIVAWAKVSKTLRFIATPVLQLDKFVKRI